MINNQMIWPILFVTAAIFGCLMVLFAPQVSIPTCIDITPGEKPIIIGYKELAQRAGPMSADKSHLKIEKIDGLWHIHNISHGKRVEVKTSVDRSRFVKRWKLQTGDQFILDDQRFKVTQIDHQGSISLLHEQTNRTAKWEKGVIKVSDPFLYVQAKSLRWRIQKRLRWILRSFHSDYWEKEMILFSLGGGVNTPDRWQIDALPPQYAYISWYKNNFYLVPGSASSRIQMAHHPHQTVFHFSQIPFPLNHPDHPVRQLIIGKTYYRVSCSDARIQLKPFRNTDAWFDHKPQEQSFGNVCVTYNTGSFIGMGSMHAGKFFNKIFVRLLVVCLIGLILSIAIYMLAARSKRFHLMAILVPSVILTGFSIICWPVHHGINISYGLLLAWMSWIWATYWLYIKGKLNGISGIIWACAIILAVTGALTLTQLAIGADNIKWLDYPRKHLLVLSMFGWFFPLMLLIPVQMIGNIFVRNKSGYRVMRIGFVTLILSILIYHFFKGNEQGLGVFQPSELAKYLLIVVGALTGMHLSEVRIYDAEHLYQDPVKMIWPFVYTFIFVTSLAFFVFLSVRDMSPIVISCLFLICCIWKIAPNPDKTKPRLFEWICHGGITVICVIGMCFIIYAYNVPENLPNSIPQKDRILVWANPALHPHSGEQVMKSMTISGLGRWFGATGSWFGNNYAAMTVPMIQNDFVGAFIIYRWGGFFATLLLVIQLTYIAAFFRTAHLIESEECYGFDRRRMNFVFRMIIYGFAWMTAIQWLISWSNVLGLFPVMGQPMTWISQANSHLIFFALPSLAFVMMVRQGDEGSIGSVPLNLSRNAF